MERKKLKIAAIVFLVVFLVSVFPLLSPVAEIQSQTREVRPQAFGVPATGTETDLATGAPTYVYGVSTSGSYLNTQINDSVFHVSADSAVNNQQTNYAASVTYTIGSSYSGGISDTYMIDSVNHVSSDPYELDMYYTFQFTICGVSNVTALSWSMRGFCGSTPNEVYIWNYATSTWVDTGQTLPTSSGTIGGTASLQFIDSSGHMKLRIWATVAFPSIYVGVDEVHWQVTYSTYSMDLSYPFRFTGGTPNTVVSMTWTAKGKTNWTTAAISFYNWINSVWDAIGAFNSTDKTYTGSVDRNYYMQSSNGSMRMRFSQLGQARPFTVSADYLAFTMVYNLAASPSYGNVVPGANPVLTNGTLAGGYWQTWTVNNSYQVVTSAGGQALNPSAWAGTGADVSGIGTVAWSNPTNLQGASDSVSATVSRTLSANTHWLQGTNFGFNIPTDVTINGIVCTFRRSGNPSDDSNDVADYSVKIVKGGSITGTDKADIYTYWPTSLSDASYGSSSDLWGTTWLPGDINANNFGCAISAAVWRTSGTVTASVDSLRITVYYTTLYKADIYYSLRFTDAAKSDVAQLGWLLNGKTSGPTITIYLYNWGGATWDSTGQTLTSTQGDKESSSVSMTDYMADNGSVRIRFFLNGQTSSFTASIDFMRIDIIYAQASDTTPPGTPNLFYPLNDQALTNGTLLVWNTTSDDAGGSGISYYEAQLSQADFTALSFDGTSDYAVSSVASSSQSFSVAVWFNIKDTAVRVMASGCSASYWDWWLYTYAGQLYIGNFATDFNGYYWIGGSVSLNAWHLAAFTWNESYGALYLDGSLVDGHADSFTKFTPQAELYIGGIGMSYLWYGSVSNALEYNRALSQAEVTYLYQNKIPQSTAGLVAYYLFDEGSGSYLYDSSGNGYTATIYGATWVNLVDPIFAFLPPAYDKTTDRTWYQFGYGDIAFTEWYWRVRAIDKAGNQGSWSETRYFYQTADPQAYIVLRDQNNAAINEYLNLAAFNMTYHRSIQDAAGRWNTLSPYMPIVNMFSSETVNITVRDWLGNYIVNNQQYSYSPTILVNLDIWDVCIGNGADAIAYIIMRSGSVFLHQFTYRGDLHWPVIAGNYNLTVIYPAVGNAQVYYNLSITGDYGIKVSSDMIADLYSAADNWEALTGNVANIVTKVNGIETEVYEFGDSQIQVKERIEGVNYNMGNLADNANILNWIIMSFAAAVVIALAAIWGRSGSRKTQEDLDHFKVINNATDRQAEILRIKMERKEKEKGGT